MGEAAYTFARRKAHWPLQEVLVKYRVKLERTDEGYAVSCPGLPGCWSQGATEEEALENIKDAIETYLATVEELTMDHATDLVEVPVRPGQHCQMSPAEHPSGQPGSTADGVPAWRILPRVEMGSGGRDVMLLANPCEGSKPSQGCHATAGVA